MNQAILQADFFIPNSYAHYGKQPDAKNAQIPSSTHTAEQL